MPPDSTGPLTYFGMYDRNVYKVQLLQKVATTIARKGRFVTSFKSGIERADSFDGASFKIKSNSKLLSNSANLYSQQNPL